MYRRYTNRHFLYLLLAIWPQLYVIFIHDVVLVYRSFRNTEIGSWYINALVRVFMEDACKLDACAMLNKVFFCPSIC